jgi:hypothetical protein
VFFFLSSRHMWFFFLCLIIDLITIFL